MSGKFEQLALGGEHARVYVGGAGDRKPGVVVFHPWWGLNADVLAYADRLAGAGFSVLAPDLVKGRVESTIEGAENLASSKDDAHADAVALAAIDRLAPPGSAERIGVVGFSMGGMWAIWSAMKRPAVAATVVYYAAVYAPSLAGATTPVLGHFAQTDEYEPEENVVGFERWLGDAGRSATIHRYPGTEHWFAEPSRDVFRPEAADLAFERTVAFLGERLHAG